ncbi:hypothetical protein OEA41_008326 [Lepraria neglecta]|uniref:Uncharacterized protein n=1 Tax=Lepraria neglecta TaxID=209136 RepID=A0AAE0DQX8_9LECA|nr:hypothetical protein OEA41_008326 [Lepraria neglecta]
MPSLRLRGTVSPTYLFNVRILQVTLAFIYLILICYSGVHHGYWNNLSQPLGFGISSSMLTILISVPSLLKRDLSTSTAVGSYVLRFMRVVFEFVMMALWAAAFVTMLLPKGKDFRLLFNKPPYAEWDIAVVLAAFQVYVNHNIV